MRKILRAAAFILVFCLLFLLVQNIFIDKHYDTIMYAQFYNEPRDSIDVFFIGASTIRASMLPAVLWEEAGITSYNFGGQATPSPTAYYVLKQALRRQSPDVVVVSAEYLFMREAFDEHDNARNRRALAYMPLSGNKIDAINEFNANGDDQGYLNYLFPLFYYHNRRDLTRRDIDISFLWQRSRHMRVQRLKDITFIPQERPGEFTNPGYWDTFDLHGEYLTDIIELCKENGIDVILCMPPICALDRWSIGRYEEMKRYADSHAVTLLDFNEQSLYSAVGIDESIDYYNKDHVNMSGGTKVSRYLAGYLSDNYDIADRRGHKYDGHWDAVMDAYRGQYGTLLGRIEEGPGSVPQSNMDADGDIG